MSDTDSFIREVEEEVRKDRMLAYWKRYGPYVVGTVVAIVGVTAGLAWLDRMERDAALERGGTLIEATDAGLGTLEAVRADIDGPAGVLADLHLARLAAEAGDREAAIDHYERAASAERAEAHYTELARLEALRLEAAEGEPAEVIAALEPLAAPGALYRPLALELRASLKANSGDEPGAVADLMAILDDPAASGETRARAEAVLAALGGPPEAGGTDPAAED